MLANIFKRGVFNFLKNQNVEHILSENIQKSTNSDTKTADVHYPVHLSTTLRLIKDNLYSDDDPDASGEPKSLLDCTLGTGGHAKQFIKTFNNLHVLGLDLDQRMIDYVHQDIQKALKTTEQNRFRSQKLNFKNIVDLSPSQSFPERFKEGDKFSCILADLGYNSMQLEGEDWGLSYNSNHPLDMRYDKETMNTTAADLLNEAPTYQLREIISRFGEEPAAEHITRVIVREREEKKIETASDLKNIIFNNMSSRVDKYKVLMRVSQALRIAINGELENLEDFMDNILIPLKKDGLGIVIAFHSLERQIISTRIKELKKRQQIRTIESDMSPSSEEIDQNSRSKSAKLYCFQKLV